MSDMLSIGASGVRAYQSALGTTSDNIANAGTAGYVRRTAAIGEVSTGATAFNGVTGLGVSVDGITRSSDAFRAADVRMASADLAKSETGIAWMSAIEGALTDGALSDRLGDFFNAASRVAADPSATAPRTAMLNAADAVAGAFNRSRAALDGAMAELDATASASVGKLNELSTAMAQVNTALGRAAQGSVGQAQLLDERDRILESISAIADVGVTADAAGRATVRIGGNGGPVLVGGSDAGMVSFARNDAGAVAFAVTRAGTSAVVSPNGGMLAGVVDGAQRIAGARDTLAGIQARFTDGVNAIQASGRDLTGVPGAAMFATDAATGAIAVALSDPRGIAAAAVGGGPRDNGNVLALAELRNAAGYESDVTALVTGNATALAGRRTVATAQSAIRDQAVAARDSISGVNLDAEAVDLIRFQQAYQASSRVIQVARETLETIFNIR